MTGIPDAHQSRADQSEYVSWKFILCLFLTPGPTLGFCPGGSLAHSRRGDLEGVAGFLPPKPVEEVTRNLAMLGTSNLQFAAHSPISDLDTLLANSTWQP